ncbi:MAG: YfhO family protein, partial [Lachnospiraceae bacterium]|nr:YfhO family protein [Lachnospiraceae bacterium]
DKPYTYLSESGGYSVYHDPYSLSMAYIAPEDLMEHVFDGESNTFDKQNELVSYWGTDLDPVYKKAESEYSLIGAKEPEAGYFVRTDDEGFIVYHVHITEDMPLYLYFVAPHMQSGEVFVNDDSLGWYFTENRWNVLCAGNFDIGDTVEIRMQILKEDLDITEACFYYEDTAALNAWAERAAVLNKEISEIKELSSSHLKFTVDTDVAEDVIVSIPYDSAWHIRCDGERIEPRPAVELLLGMEVPAGKHEIEMRYIPHGTFAGLSVSIIGIVMLVIMIVFDSRAKQHVNRE